MIKLSIVQNDSAVYSIEYIVLRREVGKGFLQRDDAGYDMPHDDRQVYMKSGRLMVFILVGAMLAGATPSRAQDAHAKPVRVCIDTNFWAPFTFAINGKAGGLHVEVARQAFERLHEAVSFHAAPWNRCIADGRAGLFDAVLSAAFNPSRTDDFLFPADADAAMSKWRVTQVDYVVVVRAADVFDWDGHDEDLPMPVGLPLGYAEVDYLRRQNIDVTTATKYGDLFRLLARGRVRSLILPRQTADMFLAGAGFETDLALLARPVRSTSYFLMVAQRGSLGEERAQKIWDEIAAIRDNEKLMADLLVRAFRDLEPCFDEIAGCTP